MHRDIKPSNLLVTVDGQVKLLDLGIASRSDLQQSTDGDEAKPQGTLDYMAPEQWTSPATVDPRTDLYSLGCTLFKLLSGSLPPKHFTASEFRPELPRTVERLLRRLLAADAADRPDSVDEVIHCLAAAARDADLTELVASVSPTPERSAQSRTTRPRRVSRRHFSRRTVVSAIAVAAGSAMLLSNLRFGKTPRLRKTEWRPLTPVAPEFLLALGDKQQASFDPNDNGVLNIVSNDLALLHLGRPVTGLFTLAVRILQEGSHGGGVFFQGQTVYSQNKRTLHFQTIEIISPGETAAAVEHPRLLWSQWTVQQSNEQINPQQTPLAELAVELAESPDGQRLQITCGRQGMPEIEWNGEKLHESMWQFSIEARNLQRLSAGQLPTAYLGRLGILNAKGSSTFIQPRLAYL